MAIILTKHAEQRLVERRIEKEEIIETIENFERLEKRNDRFYCQKRFSRGSVEVIYKNIDNNIIVITAYWV